MSLKHLIITDLSSNRNSRQVSLYVKKRFGNLALPSTEVFLKFKENDENMYTSSTTEHVIKEWCNYVFEEPLKVIGIFCKLFDAKIYKEACGDFDLKTWANQLSTRDFLIKRIQMDSLFASCQPKNYDGYRSLTINYFGLFDIFMNIKCIAYDWEANLIHPTSLHEVICFQGLLADEYKGMEIPESNAKNGIRNTSELDEICINGKLNNDDSFKFKNGSTAYSSIERMSTDNVGGIRRRLTINIEAHHDVLLEHFSRWLRQEQKINKVSTRRIKFSPTDIYKWHEMNLLAFIDLEILRMLLKQLCGMNLRITQSMYAKILYGDALEPKFHRDRKRALQREYRRLMQGTSLYTLLAEGKNYL